MPTLDKPGIVLAPYGTLYPPALATYDRIRAAYEAAFPGSPVRLAFTSRLMIRRLAEKEGIAVPDISSALSSLKGEGCRQAVLQSLQIVPGSEFHLAAAAARDWQAGDAAFDRLALGLPLLAGLEDCRRISALLPALLERSDEKEQALNETEGEAMVLVAHGTGHPADALYSLLADVLRREHRGDNVFLGSIEGYPGLFELLPELKSCAARAVRLLPFLLVAGGHAQNDIAGQSPASWKSALERVGFSVSADLRGLGECPEIVSLFLEHTRSALSKLEKSGK
jgi:sirohydrochlorin cobaltochelatase